MGGKRPFLIILFLCLLSSGMAQIHLEMDLCADDLPYNWNGMLCYGGNNIAPNGDILTIIVHQSVSTHHNDVVCQGNSFTEYGFFFSEEDTETPGVIDTVIHYPTSFGCDSAIYLTLTIQPLATIQASNDTIIFSNSATLNLAVTGTADYYVWDLNTDITAATANNTTQRVTVTQPTQYIVTGYVPGPDMVNNGSFSAGNTGFSSAYSYRPGTGNQILWDEGTYTVGSNAQNYHSAFRGAHDHTTGNGNYMIINGAPGYNTVVWTENITIEPYTYYVFNTWVTTVCDDANNSALAQLQFSINGSTIGNIFVAPSFTNSPYNTWLNFYHLWYNNSAARTATISIVNQNLTESGNDFGLDDISFCKLTGCGVSDTITVLFNHNVDTTVCENDFPFVWNGVTFNDTTPQLTILHRENKLDSVITMHVHIHDTIHTIVRETINENDLPHTFLDNVFTDAVTDTLIKLTDEFGCDSIIRYTLIVRRNSASLTEVTICESQIPFFWRGRQLYESCEISDIIPNSQGGDSVITLNLTVIDTMLRIISLTDNFCDEMSAMLSVTSGFDNYVWSSGESTPLIQVFSPGSYCVTAFSDYCTISRCISVPACHLDLKLPNAISPSKLDRHNDHFSIPETQQRLMADDGFQIFIYNRWSNLVYYSNQKNFQWDGREHRNNINKQVEINDIYCDNVYSYIIYCKDLHGQHFSFKGSIIVL